MFDVNYEEVKKLISILEESDLSVLELQTSDGQKIHLEKSAQAEAVAAPTVQATVQAPAQAPGKASQQTPGQAPPKEAGKAIKAPIVGVFYAAASPGSDPYAPIGKKVKKGDIVCIIEAMKCMNEIQAEEDGEIVEVLANDGDLVEYGQPLFKIK